MPEQVDHGCEALLAIGVDIEAGIVEESGAGPHADTAITHIVGDYLGRAIAIAAKRAFEIIAGVIENIAATPVDELEQSENRVTEAKAVTYRHVDFFGAGDAFFHHARGLVHGQRLDARDDEAGR